MEVVYGIPEEDCQKVWNVWAGKWHHGQGEWEQYWGTYAVMEEETGIPIKKLKKFIQVFLNTGATDRRTTFDSEYCPNGSGMFLISNLAEHPWSKVGPYIGKCFLEGKPVSITEILSWKMTDSRWWDDLVERGIF